ncbi:menaquinone biosynthesis decarboxylase [Fimbriimonadia bacterium ATM]|nr:MAG: menaquinone biosynthesis decarboxylase [Armatimonadota bacterium]MBC6968755.1 menaquinone biosynthesis decarboxylase [Armatimonadota bacterium]MCE7899884.1 menaquinone biosynthesis decarboxylase [Armatimonadetes bacterium ATM1]MDL1928663.1 menaquinone biosynthesis decarboxylase [Fimbriimonadia bacterium ATM]RIJ96942.1 MAG: menaquinone biosynthesis decarboxylase [Armatimonadota bacterium]
MYSDFQDFLRALERAGELKRVPVPLSPELEITEVADRCMKMPGGGPALLIENPIGSDIPVAINAFGSRKRMSMALGVGDVEEIALELESLLKPEVPVGALDKLRALSKLGRFAKSPPRKVDGGIAQEIVLTGKDVDLTRLPVLKCWPEDGGPFITLPMVFTHDPLTGKRNVGMYRIQVFDRNTTAMHWQMHKVGAEHARRAAEKKSKIEACVVLGGDPVYTFSAIAPLPPSIDEMMFAGFLRHEPVRLVKAKTVDVWVPADAEIVLEGVVDPNELRVEGPFGDHTGYYSLADMFPVFHVSAITMRQRPVYPATIVGIPPMEDGFMGQAVERIFLPLVRLVVPELLDMHLPVEACFHNMAFVKIKKRYPGHAFKVMNALWGLGQLMFTKFIFVFDEDVDVHDLRDVLFRIGANCDPKRDSLVVQGPLDQLDHASNLVGFGGKIGFDCTHKWASEGYPREWPRLITMSDSVKKRIDALWPELGL